MIKSYETALYHLNSPVFMVKTIPKPIEFSLKSSIFPYVSSFFLVCRRSAGEAPPHRAVQLGFALDAPHVGGGVLEARSLAVAEALWGLDTWGFSSMGVPQIGCLIRETTNPKWMIRKFMGVISIVHGNLGVS